MNQAATNQEKIKDIRRRMLSGAITYEEAKAEATPIIDAINARAKVIAKKYGVSTGKLNFSQLMRG